MSKKHRKQRRQFSWWLVVLGAAFLVAAVWGLSSLNGSGNDGTGGGTPVIAVDQQVIDFGDVRLGTELTFTIKVTNLGDGNLRFTEVPYIEVLEGC